jgi:hypothetical protein
VYHDDDDELDEMYQELGVAPPTRKEAYTHPVLHNRKCWGGMFLLVVIVSITVGVLVSNKSLGQEAMKLLTEEEDKLHNRLHSESKMDGSEVLTEAQRESEEYQRVTETFMPTWHDRGDGWEGQSYDEGILFCAGMSRVLCPYEGEFGRDLLWLMMDFVVDFSFDAL